MRRNPFDDLEEMLDRVSKQFETGVGGSGLSFPGSVAVDVADHRDEYVVTADLPGFETEDIELTLVEGTLRLEAEQETDRTDEHDRYLRRERSHKSVSRRLHLPEPVDEESISANYNNGVLTVTLPKLQESDDSKRIDID
ncbi:Hsp20/alpha crystallin family protein [Natronosalvus halobius]|uniref:Hsp20/alpha crystallin family protein n=1 Tax=Natronosalvus halobius TaxID=2953746 RepID=UPI00209EA733|nr:Hsp20/alpha crystallin family protein [Natronosalvus halobius]USZ70934.1 Hsp20/alpha crystallin family protein [Natronosalvus halobius]